MKKLINNLKMTRTQFDYMLLGVYIGVSIMTLAIMIIK